MHVYMLRRDVLSDTCCTSHSCLYFFCFFFFCFCVFSFFFFFFNDTATTEIYTLSLHDALPISFDELIAEAKIMEDKEQERVRGTKTPDEEESFTVL